MIIKTPIDLELTQKSGQTSQPPWNEIDGCYSNVIFVDGKPVVFNVKQSGNFLDFNYSGDISDNQAMDKLNYIFDLDFDLNKFYKYLSNHAELAEMSEFCSGLRLFLAPDPFECIISSICSANNSIKRWTKSVSRIKQNWVEITIFFLKAVTLQKYIWMRKRNLICQIFQILEAVPIILKVVVLDIEHHT